MRTIAPLLGAIVVVAMNITAPPAEAAKRCARVIQHGGAEYIVNACNTCRKVNIRRKRRGIAMPAMRTYNVQPRSKFPTPFKGVGRSRISSEIPCEGAPGGGVNIMDPRPAPIQPKKCVNLKATAAGGVVLVNNCASCRGVAVVRYAANGRSMGRQAYKMKPLSVQQVPRKGAAQVGYLADVPCPS